MRKKIGKAVDFALNAAIVGTATLAIILYGYLFLTLQIYK